MNQDRVRRYLGRLSRDRRGTSAIEFAILGATFILLMLGAIGFGLRLFTQQAMEATALQAARCRAVASSPCSSDTDATDYAVLTAQSHGVFRLTTSGVSIVTKATTTPDSSGCSLPGSNNFVEVILTLSFVSPIAGFLSNQSANIVAVSCYPVTGS